MFSVYCTSKWIHCAWIFSWVVQFHKSFVKKNVLGWKFMWPLSYGAYLGDVGWSLICFVYLNCFFFLLLLLLLFSSFSAFVSLISSIPHIRQKGNIPFHKSKVKGSELYQASTFFSLLFFIFHASLLSKPLWPIPVFCLIFSIFISQWNWFPTCLDILEPAMKSEDML